MRVSIGEIRMFFDVAGMSLVPEGPTMRERPVIIVLHGGPAFDHTLAKPLLSPLDDVAQVIFVDQRACGRTDDGPPGKWNLDTWVDDVAAFCDALELSHPILLGQSFGGFVGLGVAARYPDLPGRLVVSSSAGRFRPDRALAMFAKLGGPDVRRVAAEWFDNPGPDTGRAYRATCLPYYNPTAGDPDAFARARFRDEVGIHFWGDEMRRMNLFPELGRIRCPTLVLAGDQDPITTVADHQEVAAAIPGARLRLFEGAGHGVFRDKPEEALAVIRDFALAQV